jgi:hypothetical protein
MQVRMSTWLKLMPALGVLGLSGCLGITTLQARDFLLSTGISVGVQTFIDLLRQPLIDLINGAN